MKKRLLFFGLPLSAVLLFLSFSFGKKRELDPLALIQWVEEKDNGLKQVSTSGESTWEVLYRPVDYQIAVQERKKKLSAAVVNNNRREMKDMHYFSVTLPKPEGQETQYLQYAIAHDFKLVSALDTLTASFCLQEQRGQLEEKLVYLMAFPREQDLNDLTLVYAGKLNPAPLTWSISARVLGNIPQVKAH